MPIISKETWENLIPEEEKEKLYQLNEQLISLRDESGDRYHYFKGSIDNLNALFGKENLQPQPLTYEDVARELFPELREGVVSVEIPTFSEKEAEKLHAIGRLLATAKFLNKDWKPDEGKVDEFWTLGICKYNDEIEPICVGSYDYRTEIVYFRTEELAKQAVTILGEDMVRLALGDY